MFEYLPVRGALGRPVWGRRSCPGCRTHGGRGQGAAYPKAGQRRRTLGRWRPTLQKHKGNTDMIYCNRRGFYCEMYFHTSLVHQSLCAHLGPGDLGPGTWDHTGMTDHASIVI